MNVEESTEKKLIDDIEIKRLEKLAKQAAEYEQLRKIQIAENEQSYYAELQTEYSTDVNNELLISDTIDSKTEIPKSKRRRNAVDYATLSEQLFGQNNNIDNNNGSY